jgi:cytochrome c oxidase subunit II
MNAHIKEALPALGAIALVTVMFVVLQSSGNSQPASHAPTVVEDSKGRTIMLHTSNWQFAPNTIRLKKDENVSLHLMGIQGNHGISIPGLGVNEAMGKGSAKLVKVPTDKAGTFPFHCNVSCGPGHADMEGTIIIE